MSKKQRKACVIILRAEPAQKAQWKAAASKQGQSLSAWLRGLADAETGASDAQV